MEDMKLAALLCTRLCHDVIGPAGATVNGIELMSDDAANIDAGVIELVQQSAAETTRAGWSGSIRSCSIVVNRPATLSR